MNYMSKPETTTQTGYTRDVLIDKIGYMLKSIIPFLNKDSRLPELPFAKPSAGKKYEAFERSMYLAAFYAKATGNDTINGENYVDIYLDGLLKAASNNERYAWPVKKGAMKTTSLASCLLIARDIIWERLDNKEKKTVANFFNKHSCKHVAHVDNNHYLFHFVALPLIEECGLESPRKLQEAYLKRILNWHQGNGWFIDGAGKTVDWYTNHGFILYLQMIYYFDEVWREKYGKEIADITQKYLENYPLFFDDKGYAIQFGRGLSYRFVNVSPVGWMVVNDLWTHDLGLARGITNRSIKLFFDNGCLDENGLLTPGYFKHNRDVIEDYYEYGSSYFGINGFSSLMIDKGHDYWNMKEKTVKEGQAKINYSGIVKKDEINGARYYNIYNRGNSLMLSGHIKYIQHSFSTKTGLFYLGRNKDTYPDQTGISFDKNEWQYRANTESIKNSFNHCISRYEIQAKKEYRAYVITHHLLFAPGELYITYHTCATDLYLRVSGIAVEKEGKLNSNLEILWGPEGSYSEEYAGKNTCTEKDGFYPVWTSRSKLRPTVPVIYAVTCQNKETTLERPSIRRDDTEFIIKWGNESINIDLPGLNCRLEDIEIQK